MSNEGKLEKFNIAIDEIISAKFILADVKIGNLISVMAADDDIYHLLGQVLKGFDFDAESPKYLLGDVLEMPSKPRDVVAFTFCLLVAIHDKKFSLYDFLHQYFIADSINSSYLKFVNKVILPFKQVIVETIIGEGEKDLGPAPKTTAEILFDICRELQEECKNFKNTYDSYIILGAMIDASRRGDLNLFRSLEVALKNSTKNRKFIKYAEEKIGEAF